MTPRDVKDLLKQQAFTEALDALSAIEKERGLTPHELVLRGHAIQLAPEGPEWELADVEASYLKALELEPDYVPALIELGYFYHAVMDNTRKAQPLMEKAVFVSRSLLTEAAIGNRECLEEIWGPSAAEEFVKELNQSALLKEIFDGDKLERSTLGDTIKAEPADLRALLDRMVGLECVGYTAGWSTGSVIDLEVGPRRPRSVPLKNPFLTEEQRTGKSEYSVFVHCSWRLDGPGGVICGAWDDYDQGGPKLRGLDALVGQRVVSYALNEPGWDLDLRFGNGWTFRIFCDQVNEYDGNDNYNVFGPEEILSVGMKSRLTREGRRSG